MTDLKFIAQQLRKPSGDFAPKIAAKMGEGNRPLYDLVLDFMDVQDYDSILEIGFGNGHHFSGLLAKAENLWVAGIDYSAEMTELAESNNKPFIASGRLKLQTGNSNRLPFADNSFDTVFCNMVIYFWDDPEKHLEEIRRVLKPGGRFYTGMRTRKSMLELPFTKYGFNLYETGEWSAILESNGFHVEKEARGKDPVFNDDGNQFQLESVCIAAHT